MSYYSTIREFTVVTRYKTIDGRLFETAEEASEHVKEEILGAFDSIVKSTIGANNWPITTLIPLVENLYASRDLIYRALLMERKAPEQE